MGMTGNNYPDISVGSGNNRHIAEFSYVEFCNAAPKACS